MTAERWKYSGGIFCPACRSDETTVKDSRPNPRGLRRRRRCNNCDARFTTVESIVGSDGLMCLVTPTGRVIPVDVDLTALIDRMSEEAAVEIKAKMQALLTQALG